MKIAIIGAGNVAWHLAPAIDQHCEVVAVYSRDIAHAQALAQRLTNAIAIDNLSLLPRDLDAVVVSVKDDAIASIIASAPLHAHQALWMHTSGGCGIEVFGNCFPQCAVLYPLQTFTQGATLAVNEIPFFIEGNDEQSLARVRALAAMLSPTVYDADSTTRRRLHIAAVMACNFTNHLYALSRDILSPTGIPFSALLPLIGATVEKIATIPPEVAQTGPAVRGDQKVIDAHLATLTDPHLKEIYSLLSNSITNYRKNEND